MLRSLMMAALLWVGPHQGPHGDPWPPSDQARPPVVHAVFFYSPSCPHCHTVIQEHLLPLQSEYGEQLRILAMDVSTTWGQELFRATMTHLGVPQDQWGVPYMLVGDEVMTGSLEIPDRLPGRIREGLAGDGIDLPNVGPILDFLDARGALLTVEPGPRYLFRDPAAPSPEAEAAPDTAGEAPRESPNATPEAQSPRAQPPQEQASAPEAQTRPEEPPPEQASAPEAQTRPEEPPPEPRPATASEEASPGDTSHAGAAPLPSDTDGLALGTAAERTLTPWDRFRMDPAGNSLAVLVLLLTVAALVWSLATRTRPRRAWPGWSVPLLALLGLGVAGYLSWVEVTGHAAVCGPVGDCNTVQQSSYARLFGLVPIGVLGAGAYLAVAALWLIKQTAGAHTRRLAEGTLWAITLGGTAFSAYLTFLEPFVIGATCMWCLTSAVLITCLLLATTPPAPGAVADG